MTNEELQRRLSTLQEQAWAIMPEGQAFENQPPLHPKTKFGSELATDLGRLAGALSAFAASGEKGLGLRQCVNFEAGRLLLGVSYAEGRVLRGELVIDQHLTTEVAGAVGDALKIVAAEK